jgi:hypothetical protein
MPNNFDFFVGEWTSKQRRLREVLADCDEWYEFEGHTRCWSVFGGAGNVDEVSFPSEGFSGLSFRLYDPGTDTWSIYWVNSRTGLALPPVTGRFDETGRGVFTSEEDYHGRPIVVHFIWSEITADSARWEQEFSPDGGTTWETNWVADFARVS